MRIDRQIAFALLVGTALHFLLPATPDWLAPLCEKWIAVELVLRMLKK